MFVKPLFVENGFIRNFLYPYCSIYLLIKYPQTKTEILPSYRTDHSTIVLTLQINEFIKGKGLWKFNNSLLKDMNYILKRLKSVLIM